LLLAVFELVLFMIVPRDLPVHYYAFYAIQKVHFFITLILLDSQNERYNEVAVYVVDCGQTDRHTDRHIDIQTVHRQDRSCR